MRNRATLLAWPGLHGPGHRHATEGRWRAARTMLSPFIALVIWQGLASIVPGDVPFPIAVARVFVRDVMSGLLLTNILYSLVRVLVGFTLGLGLAVPVAFLLRRYSALHDIVDPWIQFFRMIPAIALIPAVIVVFGIGEVPKVLVIFFAVFFITVIVSYQGIGTIDAVLVNAARVLGARGPTLFLKVILPAALPGILTAARLAVAVGWATLVAAELIAASHGLGYMITTAEGYFDLPTMYLGIICIGLVGIALDRGILLVERRVTAWADVADLRGGTVALGDFGGEAR